MNGLFAEDVYKRQDEGKEKFAEATRKAYEKGETLAIYYDGNFVSVPSVKAVLTDGRAQISPMESFEAADSLASTIRIGGLKLELDCLLYTSRCV